MAKYRPKIGDDVAVYWHDACSTGGWVGSDDIPKLSEAAFRTVGTFLGYSVTKFKVGKPQKSILIASSTSIVSGKHLDSIGDCHSIPKTTILAIRRLK